MPPKKIAFPSATQAAFLLLADFLLQYVVGVALYDFRRPLGLTDAQLGALVMVLANGILITVVLHMQGASYRDLIHESKSSALATFFFLVPPVLLLTPLIVLLDGAMISALQAVFPVSAWEERAFAGMMSPSLPAFVAVCLIAPVVEEMLFRGILLRAFLERYPRGLAIGYSGLYFGVAHLNVYQFVFAFLMGLLLGWLFERSRSLVPCVALHAAVNSTIFGWMATNAADAGQAVQGTSPLTWGAAVVAGVIGTIALQRLLAPRRTAAESGS